MNMTYLYGFISNSGAPKSDYAVMKHKHNSKVIRSLPRYPYLTSGMEWPLFHSSMFSLGPFSAGISDLPHYDRFLIYFAGTYKQMDELDIEWQNKFESLLSMLYWNYSVVILETQMGKDLRYEWRIDPLKSEYNPLTKYPSIYDWKRSCYECIYNSVPWMNS